MKSKITLGLWALGNSEGFHNPMTAREAKDIIKDAYKKGIRSFDSAFSYGTDNLLYSALKEIGIKTSDVEIFEKIMPYQSLRKKAEASLRALKTEKAEAIIIHWPRRKEELFAALKEAEKMVEEGKFNELGISNFPASLTKKISSSFEITYDEYFFSPTYAPEPQKGFKNLKYGIFSLGSLLKDEKEEDRRKDLFYYSEDAFPLFLQLKQTIRRIAEERGCTLRDVLLSFALYDNPYRVIIGSRRKEHIDLPSNIISMEEKDYSAIMEKSRALSHYMKGDNIFNHDWRAL